MPDNARERAAKIKLLVLDVDGVLTDGGLYYDADGRVMKRFNVQDGLGIKLAQAAGVEVGVITGLNHKAVETRVRELGIEHYYPGKRRKLPLFQEMCEKVGVTADQAAFLGDDWVDVGVMRKVGLSMAVNNAVPEVLKEAHWVSTRAGGHGAVREAVQFILDAQGLLDGLWQKWAD
ncbi:KdsC family phosphatase [Pseudodesulfovibrio tunisiensis]|uniref:KdsC family phosphatase n=1 Tax=Pseudodesulfovibrio tunisiensis TaxID=463192 RepID=UPI001FB271E2|nr:HAD-IIIA family hydrolase [Pseudodesulfovibrio tunisiensis]